MNDEIALIVGRSVTDYMVCGHKLPVGARIIPCVVCGSSIALGKTGQARLTTGPSLVFCTPCIQVMARKGPINVSDALTSPDLQAQFRRNPGLEKKVSDLLQSLGAK